MNNVKLYAKTRHRQIITTYKNLNLLELVNYYRIAIILVFSLIAVFGNQPLFSQSNEIDSLEKLLIEQSLSDTMRIKILNETAKKYRPVDLEKTLQYASQADSLSDILNYQKGKAESLQILGHYYFYRQDIPGALSHYQQALEISQKTGYKTGVSYSFNYIGNIHLTMGDYAQALEYYQKAIAVFEENGDKIGISGCYNNIGNIYYMQGDYPRTLEYYHKALKVFEELNNKTGVSGLYNNIGVIYDAQKKHSKALEYYQKALKIREEINDIDGITDTYRNIGTAYFQQNDYSKALEYFQKGLKINEDQTDKYGIAVTYGNIGAISKSQKAYDKAQEYYQKSIELAEEIGALDVITFNNIEFSDLHYELKNYELAIEYGEKAYQYAIESGEKANIKGASEVLANCYAAMGNYQKAYEYHVEFKAQSDSLQNEANTEKIVALEYEYKYEKEKELAAIEQEKKEIALKAETKRQKTIRNTFIAGFILALLLIIVVLRSFIQKRKANQMLAKQKQEIEAQAIELQATNEKLLELDAFKRGLTSMIVHDLKNPLNGILNVSHSYPPEIQVTLMKQIGKQMLNLVLNILDVNKYEEIQMTVDKNPFSLVQIAEKATSGIQFLAHQKNISINLTIPLSLKVSGDAEIVERVFTNLLTNAIKYSPNNGIITIEAQMDESHPEFIQISVSDTGEGIPADKLHLVFSKFGQVSAKKSGSIRSTGLGLTFCKMAVEAHGGTMNVKSELHKGSCFDFTLPSADKNEIPEQITQINQSAEADYSLNADEKELLKPFVNLFKKTEIYKMLELRKLLRKIPEESHNIRKWKNEIRNAIGSGNKDKYEQLLEI
jgi:signal transduction histidine kinase/Tfp pilus assembly protein PilF